MDDSTRLLGLPPTWRASVSPAIAALRWGALGYGLIFAAPVAFRGSYAAVAATAICFFVTTWRTVLPLRLGAHDVFHRLEPFVDVAAVGVAMGIAGGWSSPYYFALLVVVAVVGFGWGGGDGTAALFVAAGTVVATSVLDGTSPARILSDQRDVAAVTTLALAVAIVAYARSLIKATEEGRSDLVQEVTQLAEANQLLEMLNVAARRLPDALSLRDALDRVRHQMSETFDARVICLMTYDDASEEWVPKIADGCALRPAYPRSELPPALRQALGSSRVLLLGSDLVTVHDKVSDSDEHGTDEHGTDVVTHPIVRSSRAGMYVRLTARGETVGILGVEHPSQGRYDLHDAVLLAALAEVLALTVDNARWFGRLRTLGAQEERIRIARDLHDRLGQWLTYVSMELDRITASDHPAPADLLRLRSDVQAALDELRETLRQLRSGVTDQKPLAVVAGDVVARFSERADVAATLTVVHPEDRVPVPVENELLRILQEALTNVDRHAGADHVDVVWDVRGGDFELVVVDDGRGFESAKGVRDSAYGLVGMRERADVIGARLLIDSRPGVGTTVRVHSGATPPVASDPIGSHRNAPAGPPAADRTTTGSSTDRAAATVDPGTRDDNDDRDNDDREVAS
ncbi:MAG: sensor histidine kinase [Actinobacteria bacterium]|nr:sensor histidine kinase [Actinomycetota bacterium]